MHTLMKICGKVFVTQFTLVKSGIQTNTSVLQAKLPSVSGIWTEFTWYGGLV